MPSTNTYITEQAAALESPLTFTANAGVAATAQANIDAFINLLSLEGSEISTPRLFLDEMSPAARLSVIATLLALRAAMTDA